MSRRRILLRDDANRGRAESSPRFNTLTWDDADGSHAHWHLISPTKMKEDHEVAAEERTKASQKLEDEEAYSIGHAK